MRGYVLNISIRILQACHEQNNSGNRGEQSVIQTRILFLTLFH